VRRAARWDLLPFAAPPAPPAVRPVRADTAAPPVIDHVPTDEKIVFVTIDDGAEKDPAFVEMLRDLRVPVTMFLTDSYVRENPGYFRQLLDTGFATAQNHSLTHPNLVTLGADAQRREVCGQQERLAAEFGVRPYLLRAPYGNSDETTRRVAATCGVGAIVKWRESMQRNDMQYQGAKVLRPGDIILAHFRGPSELGGMTMTQMMGNLFRRIQAQGFTIARLEDYV
jgi:peptidoglycan/xylan/chitin deacetylase (PgdA/CDA1 family)